MNIMIFSSMHFQDCWYGVMLCWDVENLKLGVLFLQASVSDGENSRNLSKVMIGGLFLR